MTIPKIKWCVEKNDIRTSLWYTIIAEVDLGSARYKEMYTVYQDDIDACRNGDGVLWKITEKMRWNILDALGYYDFDAPVSYDLERIQASLNSGTIVVPSGLSCLDRREWIRNNKGKVK